MLSLFLIGGIRLWNFVRSAHARPPKLSAEETKTKVELLRSLHHPFIVGYEESFPQGGSLVPDLIFGFR